MKQRGKDQRRVHAIMSSCLPVSQLTEFTLAVSGSGCFLVCLLAGLLAGLLPGLLPFGLGPPVLPRFAWKEAVTGIQHDMNTVKNVQGIFFGNSLGIIIARSVQVRRGDRSRLCL